MVIDNRVAPDISDIAQSAEKFSVPIEFDDVSVSVTRVVIGEGRKGHVI